MNTPPLRLKDTGRCRWGRPIFELEEPVWYIFHVTGPYVMKDIGCVDITIKVPQGFLTDFASIPRLFWPILPPFGPWRYAAVIHDYLFTLDCPHFLIDAIFRHIMEEFKDIRTWQRVVIYYAVRAYWVGLGQFLQGWRRRQLRSLQEKGSE